MVIKNLLHLLNETTKKTNIMKTIKLTSSEFLNKVNLGHINIVTQISVFIFEVEINNLNGSVEKCLINIK